jgi:hypothetical protein
MQAGDGASWAPAASHAASSAGGSGLGPGLVWQGPHAPRDATQGPMLSRSVGRDAGPAAGIVAARPAGGRGGDVAVVRAAASVEGAAAARFEVGKRPERFGYPGAPSWHGTEEIERRERDEGGGGGGGRRRASRGGHHR